MGFAGQPWKQRAYHLGDCAQGFDDVVWRVGTHQFERKVEVGQSGPLREPSRGRLACLEVLVAESLDELGIRVQLVHGGVDGSQRVWSEEAPAGCDGSSVLVQDVGWDTGVELADVNVE